MGKGWRGRRLLYLAAAAAFVTLAVVLLLPPPPPRPLATGAGMRAAVVDALGGRFSNPEGVEAIIRVLREAGLEVDYYRRGLDVEFFRNLLSTGYRVIVLRVHSTRTPDLRPQGYGLEEGSVAIMTEERYSPALHVQEQLDDLLIPSSVLGSPENPVAYGYFAFTRYFVRRYARLNETLVLVVGCYGLHRTGMAEAFLDKGAVAYVAFPDLVTVPHADKVAEEFLRALLLEGASLGDAVKAANERAGPDPFYGTLLDYYPKSAAGMRLVEGG